MLRLRTACLLIALAAALPRPAHAQPAPRPASAQEDARVKAEEGFKLYGEDRFADALERFTAADALFHAPSLVLYMARCQRKLGKLVAARDLYEKVIAEHIPNGAPTAYVEAQRDAKRELEALRGRIPTLQIIITGVPLDSARATIDGDPAPVRKERVELDPGTHSIEAISERAKHVERRSVTLAEGGAEKVEIALTPRTPADAAPPAPTGPAAEPTPAHRRGSAVPGAVVLGVGGASLLVGAITGAMSLGKVSDIKALCNGTVCPAAQQSAGDSAKTLGNVSTAMFVVGGVAAAAGAVLLVVRPGGGSAPPPSAARGITWTGGIGLGRLEITGSF